MGWLRRNEEETKQEVQSWCASLAVDKLPTVFEELCEWPDHDSEFPRAAVLSRVIAEGKVSLAELLEMMERVMLYDAGHNWFLNAMAREAVFWSEQVLEHWEEVALAPAGSRLVNAVVWNLGSDSLAFAQRIIDEGFHDRAPSLAADVFRPLPWRIGAEDLRSFWEAHVEWIADNVLRIFVRLVHHGQYGDLSDWIMNRFLDRHPTEAAEAIVADYRWLEVDRPWIFDAARILWDNERRDELMADGLCLAVQVDKGWGLPKIVGLAHDLTLSEGRWSFRNKRLDKHLDAAELLEALASDASERPRSWHGLLADIDEDLVAETAALIEWLERVSPGDVTLPYTAELLMETLSRKDLKHGSEELKRLEVVAEALHNKHGNNPEKLVLAKSLAVTLKGTDKFHLARALALAGDVLHGEPPEVDVEEYCDYMAEIFPNSYNALGEERLAQYMSGGDLPLYWYLFNPGLEARLDQLVSQIEEFESDGKDAMGHRMFASSLARDLIRRQKWEEAFGKIRDSGHNVSTKRLWDEVGYWAECRIHAKLVDHFDVTREPTDVEGLESNPLDFRLNCAEGSIILEVTSMRGSPFDSLRGVRASLGNDPESRIDGKWSKQLHRCSFEAKEPIVIAIGLQHEHMLDMDLNNSLYGAFQVSFATNPETGEIVRDGTSRSSENGLFNRESVGCIAGVVGFADPSWEAPQLIGDFYPPLREPQCPLSPRLWAKLRDALFGPELTKTWPKWKNLPGITDDEIKELVRLGCDEPGLMAAGYFERPDDAGIDDERWRYIAETCVRRQHLQATGSVRFLRTVDDDTLRSLSAAKIHLIRSLLETEGPPSGISGEQLVAMQNEAKGYGFKRQDNG